MLFIDVDAPSNSKLLFEILKYSLLKVNFLESTLNPFDAMQFINNNELKGHPIGRKFEENYYRNSAIWLNFKGGFIFLIYFSVSVILLRIIGSTFKKCIVRGYGKPFFDI